MLPTSHESISSTSIRTTSEIATTTPASPGAIRTAQHGSESNAHTGTEERKWSGKKKIEKAGTGGGIAGFNGKSPISQLPIETLAHIFAQLSPSGLVVAQLVCRDWRDVVEDEASWRTAFETYYGILNDGLALGRRLDPFKWRTEYTNRVALSTRWTKSRNPSVIHDPLIGPISSIHIIFPPSLPLTRVSNHATSSRNQNPSLLSLSLPLGRATKSDPYTGKVSKTRLESSPTDNLGQPVGLPLVAATSFAISADGTRIVWGMMDGTFRILNSGTAVTLAARAWAGVGDGVRSMLAHSQEVIILSFSSTTTLPAKGDVFVSAAKDGVALWILGDSAREVPGKQVWRRKISTSTVGGPRLGATVPKPTCVAFDSGWVGKHTRKAIVALGMEDGTIHVWSEVELGSGTTLASSEAERYRCIDALTSEPIDHLFLDLPSQTSSDFQLLAHSRKSASFSRIAFPTSTDSNVHNLTITRFGHDKDYLGSMTAFAVDFDEPPRVSKDGVTARVVLPDDPGLTKSQDLTNLQLEISGPTLSLNPVVELHGSNAFGRRKYVVTGDSEGRVYTWDWDEVLLPHRDCVGPQKMLQGLESRVTALEITAAVIYIGGLDGTIRCYDPLTSTVLRVFKDRSASRLPARMLAAGLLDPSDEERWKVSMIRATKDEMVAAVGGRILSWRTTSGELKKRAGKATGGASSGRMSVKGERYRSEWELRQEVKESVKTLSVESSSRLQHFRNERRVATEFGLPTTLDNLTEEEAVNFALMLSAEDADEKFMNNLDLEGFSLEDTANHQSHQSSSSYQGDDFEDDFEYDEDAYEHSSHASIPPSPLLLAASSSSSSPARSWTPQSPPFVSYEPHSYNSNHSNRKVQLSPRLGPTYGSVGASSYEAIPDMDMSEEVWPSAGLSPSAPSTPAMPGASTPVKRGWNDIARSASASRSPGTDSPSGLSKQLGSGGSGSPLSAWSSPAGAKKTREETEDDDLRFAMELSLAEENSRYM